MSKRKAETQNGREQEFEVVVPGSDGSFTANAARTYFKGNNINLVGCSSTKKAFAMVEEGKCKYAVLPCESSMSGSLRETHDSLVKHNLFIVGEIAQEEEHCLLAKKGTKVADIQRVYSHVHLLDQCSLFLDELEEKKGEGVFERLCVSNSIAGCKKVAANGDGLEGVIAHRNAAKEHDLEVVAEKISNYTPMKTRYIVLAKEQVTIFEPFTDKKASICVALGNASGSFHKVFSAFGFRHVDIIRVTCRPCFTALSMFSGPSLQHWDYIYHIDYVPPNDQKTADALMANLKEFCMTVREFGTYKMSVTPTGINKMSLLNSPVSDSMSATMRPEMHHLL